MTNPAPIVRLPNILITGTPGTGKTSLSNMLLQKLAANLHSNTAALGGTTAAAAASKFAGEGSFQLVQVGDLVKSHGFHNGPDPEFQDSLLIDEDAVLDFMEPLMGRPLEEDTSSVSRAGGVIVDHHSSAFFPERWFDLIVCLTCDTSLLYDRLQARNYKENKITENIQCEIMAVCLEECMESYPPEIVVKLESNTQEERDGNCERILAWIQSFIQDSDAEMTVDENDDEEEEDFTDEMR